MIGRLEDSLRNRPSKFTVDKKYTLVNSGQFTDVPRGLYPLVIREETNQ